MQASQTFTDAVRASFPVFARRVAGKPIAFFDGPGGSQVPQEVAAAVAQYLTLHNANTHGHFLTSEETDAAMTAAREAFADFLGAGSPREIVFGANMTTLAFHLARSLGRELQQGDEIVVTELDHQANQAPWRRMAEDRGLTVRAVPFNPETMQLDYAAMQQMIGPKTRFVAVGGASNAVGTINDVRRVTEMARAVGAITFVDAVHLAPHRRIDVQALGCDFLACSAYKFFGPHVGILWGRRELLERLTPYKVPPASDDAPERWETGTQNHEGIVGAAAAVDWIAGLAGAPAGGRRSALDQAFELIEAHERELYDRMIAGIRSIPGTRVYGVPDGEARTPTLGFTVSGAAPDEVARRLGDEGVFVWNGNFYASTVCERLALDDCGGLIRAGLAPYTTAEDVDRLVDGVRRITGA
ncbi:MAG: cysteine desulfurase-like protein [Gemmatimonadetes bacterium]|nr:cysteine desulfurase-like protein [Gemmatimonadota bacterium]